ncbi:sensor domain-containing protein [Actinocorallia sp. B10E7]|uniref:sensor domain-containing protein n=1 Tax=Actinocorallia sp. B10E7 TaxID=3153558 RepID=UPI00325F67C8
MTTTTMRLERPPVRIRGVRRVLLDSAYALTAFPISLAAFVVVASVLATGLGLSVLGVGFALVALAVLIARGFAVAERTRLRGMLGRVAPGPRYLRGARATASCGGSSRPCATRRAGWTSCGRWWAS